ncbi:MAG: cytochrome P450 [Kiloniellales bacterium]
MTLVLPAPRGALRPAMPEVGRGFGIGLGLEIRRDPLAFFLRLREEHGDLVRLNLKPRSLVVISRPELIGPILNEHHYRFHKSSFMQLLRPVIGNALLLSEGKAWKDQRQTAAPGFNGAALASYCAAIDAEARLLAERWSRQARDGETLNASRGLSKLTLQVILRTLFGQGSGERWEELYLSLSAVMRTIEKRFWSLWPLSAHLPTPENFRFASDVRTLRNQIAEVIASAFAEQPAVRAEGAPPGGRLIDHLLLMYSAEGARPDPRLLADEALIYILAGIDTTANAISWTLHLLNRHPEIAERVRDEADAACAGGQALTMGRMEALPLTRAALCEALRLYPPVWTFSRIAVEDVELPGLSLKKGQNVMISPWVLHRDRRLWPNPERFDPSRFESGLPARGRGYSYLPFGYGPRGCLGARFAMMEAMIVVARLFHRLRLTSFAGRPVRPEPMITLRPSPDLLLRGEARA